MRSVSIVLIIVIAAMAAASPAHRKPHYDLTDAPALFEKFIKDYNRHYKDEEDKYKHYFAFFMNLLEINRMNAINDIQGVNAWFAINSFADYTKEEENNLFGLGISSQH